MGQSDYSESIRSLTGLGFTEIEAAAYAFLVNNSPATAYKVAKGIGKPVANTYKAVQALFDKGAIMIDETQNRLCQAVDPDTLMDGLKNNFLEKQASAKDALAKLSPSVDSERIYSLGTTEQVFERCRKMCEDASSILLVDAFPGVVDTLRPWLEKAAGSGVEVVIHTYAGEKIKGAEIVPNLHADEMLGRWQGHWLIIVADGAEYLQAFLSSDLRSVLVANWCGSAFLALPQHNFLANTFRQALTEEGIRNRRAPEELYDELLRTNKWQTMGERGYASLRERFTASNNSG